MGDLDLILALQENRKLEAENERLKEAMEALEYIVVCHEMVASERARFFAVSESVAAAKRLLAELAELEKGEGE